MVLPPYCFDSEAFEWSAEADAWQITTDDGAVGTVLAADETSAVIDWGEGRTERRVFDEDAGKMTVTSPAPQEL